MPATPHELRFQRAFDSLDGLSVGDAFGQGFFAVGTDRYAWQNRLASRQPLPGIWTYTDDTEMALAIMEVLSRHQEIHQDDLAATFARRYARDERRGYGGMAHRILTEIGAGVPWRDASSSVFNGTGSLGNGGAMRVAPLGAYFADDLPTAIEQAQLSAEVTHFHPEGKAGTIAVAVAAAFAWQHRGDSTSNAGREMLQLTIDQTPDGRVRNGLLKALDLPLDTEILKAAGVLGNGSSVTAPDTVPLTIWCAARHFSSFEDAIWTTVAAGGDIDTNCAIVGGIVALSAGRNSIPPAWLAARESLQFESM